MRNRVRADGACSPRHDSVNIPARQARDPRTARAWNRDLRSGTAFAALFALGLIGLTPAVQASDAALPTGGAVTHGDAAITAAGNGLLINQTSGSAIISWDTFSIGAGGITHFNNGSGATLNRVGGNVPSTIDGSLSATGSLFLVNPAGVTVGTGGMVATGGSFIASTHDVSDADFLNGGDTVFAGDSKAEIVNHGTISSAMGDVALIGRRVENTGDISAANGTAALLAGYDVLMHETTGANGKFAVRVGGSDTEAVNTGTINAAEVELRANGGNVLALAGNTQGVVKATGVARSGGRIFLTAGGGKVQTSGRVTARRRVSSGSSQQAGGDVFINADTVLASGSIDVSGLGAVGGNIDIGGRDIALQGAALNASGDTGGGRIRVGGEYQGGKDLATDEVENADTLLIDATSSLLADGTSGNAAGGTVIAWSDGTTTFDGLISATSQAGGGGFVETSGAHLDLHGRVDVASALGTSGTWLIDPTNIEVNAALIATVIDQLRAGIDLILSTAGPGSDSGTITLIDPLTVDFALDASPDDEATITAFANDSITTSAAITALNGVLNLNATALNGVTIGAAINTNGGDVTISTDNVAINDTIDAGTGIVTIANESAGRGITLGTEVGGTLSLTDAEIDNITADILRIGSSTAGSITFTDTISPAGTDTLSLITGDQILDAHAVNAADIEVANLALRAVNGIADNEGLNTEVETLAALNTTDNSIAVIERRPGGSLTIGTVDGLTGVVNQGAGPHPGQRSIQIETDDGDLTVAAGSQVTSTNGGIFLVAQHENGGAGDRLFTNNGAITMQGGNGRIEIVANNMDLGTTAVGSSISSQNGARVVLTDDPSSISTIAIQIGDGATDGVNTLGLTNEELDTVATTGTLQIGHAGSGAVTAGNIDISGVGGVEINTAGNATFNGTIDGAFDLTVNSPGVTRFNDQVGTNDELSSLTTDGGGTTVLNAPAIVAGSPPNFHTNGAITFNDAVLIDRPVYIRSDSSASAITFASTVDGVGGNEQLLVFGNGELVLGGNVGGTAAAPTLLAVVASNSGPVSIGGDITTTNLQTYIGAITLTGDATITSTGNSNISFFSTIDGGFDLSVATGGTTTFSGAVGGTTPLASLTTNTGGTTIITGLAATTGDQIYNDQVTDNGTVFVSTAGSLTFAAGIVPIDSSDPLWLLAADDINIGGDIQWDGTGDLTLVAGWNAATDGSTGWTLGDDFAVTTILDDAGNFGQGTGDISIGTTAQTTGISVGSRGGTTTALAQNMYLASSTSDDGYAQLGFHGAATGNIDVMLTEDLTTLTAAGLRSFVQIGHGGHDDDNDHSGDISINVGEGVLLSGGGNTQAYALFGHGGFESDGNNSGAIELAITEGLTVRGGTGTNAYAQIGHGDASFNSSGTRMGDISAIVGGLTTLTDETGGAWFGHATTTGDGVSNANVALVTNGLDTSDTTRFARMIWNDLHGGDVLIANLAPASSFHALVGGDGGSANIGTDDIVFDGDPFLQTFATDNSLTLTAGGDVAIYVSLLLNGTGDINLIGGWDGATGLDTSGFPMLDVDEVIAGVDSDVFGVTGGDVYIGDEDQTFSVSIGTRQGEINVLAHDLEVIGSDDNDNAYSRLGYETIGDANIDSNINIWAMDDVLVLADDAFAQIGHINLEGEGPVGGNITILNDTANDNEIYVEGGDNPDALAQIGHTQHFDGRAFGDFFIRSEDITVYGGVDEDAFAQIGHNGTGEASGNFDIQASNDLEVLGGDDFLASAQIGHYGEDASGDIKVAVLDDLSVIGGSDDEAYAQIGHIGDTAWGLIDIDVSELALLIGGPGDAAETQIGHNSAGSSEGEIELDVGESLVILALGEDALSYIGHSSSGTTSGGVSVNVAENLIMGTLGFDTGAQIGHLGDGDNTGNIGVDVGETLFHGNLLGTSYTKIGHGNFTSSGAQSGDIDVTADGPIALYGSAFIPLPGFSQIGHGDPFGFSTGTRQGDITVITDGEMTLDDGLAGGSLAWIGHGTGTAGGVSDADVFLQAFGFDRDLLSTVPAGDLGRFNKDIIEADIPFGDFTLIATGTGLLVEDPIYNSPFQLLMSVNNDMVLDTNAIFVNSGTGNIILAAGGDFHNDTGSLTPITTGGRWLVYSTRPDNDRNDIEITNWDFLRYATNFDINNPLVGSGDGLIYSVAPVVNFNVSSHVIDYSEAFTPTVTQFLTVNGVQVDPIAFGLGINPATAQWAFAPFVTIDALGNPRVGFYDDGLTTSNETIPYFGMSFVTNPGDLTVGGATPITDRSTGPTTFASMGIGEMCAFRSDDEDPEEGGERYDRIIELCGIIESDKD